MFGKQKRVFIQFLIGLILTLTASGILTALKGVGVDLSNPQTILSNQYAQILNNTLFSLFYISLPFVAMIIIDIRAILKTKK